MKVNKKVLKLVGSLAFAAIMAVVSEKDKIDKDNTIIDMGKRISELEGLLKKEES